MQLRQYPDCLLQGRIPRVLLVQRLEVKDLAKAFLLFDVRRRYRPPSS